LSADLLDRFWECYEETGPSFGIAPETQSESQEDPLTEGLLLTDLVYVPTNAWGWAPLSAVVRTPSGNRSNAVALELERDESTRVQRRIVRRICLKHRVTQKKKSVFRDGLVAAVLFLALQVVGVGLHMRSLSPVEGPVPRQFSAVSQPRAHVAPVPVQPTIRRDDSGLPVEIRSADPQSVLLSYCRSLEGGFCDPVELAWTEPLQPGLRVGVFRAFHDLRAIEIRRDPLTRQWVAGDGRGPVTSFPTQARRLSKARVPTSRPGSIVAVSGSRNDSAPLLR
jgi:hypothetical protein